MLIYFFNKTLKKIDKKLLSTNKYNNQVKNLEKIFKKAFKWVKTQKVPSAFDNKFLSYFKKDRGYVIFQEIYSHNRF